MSNNIITKNYKPKVEANKTDNFFHILVLYNLIDGGRLDGTVTITNKRLIIQYKTKLGHPYRENYDYKE